MSQQPSYASALYPFQNPENWLAYYSAPGWSKNNLSAALYQLHDAYIDYIPRALAQKVEAVAWHVSCTDQALHAEQALDPKYRVFTKHEWITSQRDDISPLMVLVKSPDACAREGNYPDLPSFLWELNDLVARTLGDDDLAEWTGRYNRVGRKLEEEKRDMDRRL